MTRSRFEVPAANILQARQQLVLDHIHNEILHDWDATLSTFPHPYYELIPTMTVHDGDAAVRDYYNESRVAFPDQRSEVIDLRHSHDAVITEFWLMGTHRGPLGQIPPTGGSFRVRMLAIFQFDEDEHLIAERIYFDSLSILKQILGALNFKNPVSLLKAIKALRGLITLSREPDPRLLQTVTPPDLAAHQSVPGPTA